MKSKTEPCFKAILPSSSGNYGFYRVQRIPRKRSLWLANNQCPSHTNGTEGETCLSLIHTETKLWVQTSVGLAEEEEEEKKEIQLRPLQSWTESSEGDKSEEPL